MEKLEIFSYSGIDVIIKKGRDFSKNELKSRLNRMGIDISDIKDTKAELEKLYDKTIKLDSNKEKIFDKLQKDSANNSFLINNERKKLYDDPEEREEESINKKIEMPKRVLIKNEAIDEDKHTVTVKVNKDLNNCNINSRHINNTRIYFNNNSQNNKSKYGLYISLILLGFLFFYITIKIIHNLDSIEEEVSDIIGLITVSLFGSSVILVYFFGAIISILQLIVLCFILFHLGYRPYCFCCLCNCIGRYKFKNKCKKIFEDIKKLLKKQMNNTLTENDIIECFWIYYSNDRNEFITKYLKELILLSENDNSVKRYSDYNDKGNKEIFWELIR